MPTIIVSKKDFEQLYGKKVGEEELDELLLKVKGELENVNGDELKIELNDTNRVDTWTVEGIVQTLKGDYKKPCVRKGSNRLIVKKVGVRPFVSGFIVKQVSVSEGFLKSLIQAQEVISENFGKKRSKVGVGVYNAEKIKFPLTYESSGENDVMIPLGMNEEMSLLEVLKKHEKGVKYGHLLEGVKRFPVFRDANGVIISMPPIINNNQAGRVGVGVQDLFVEVTGTDERGVKLVTNIFLMIFTMRGYEVESLNNETLPHVISENVEFKLSDLNSWTGLNIGIRELKRLLESMGYEIVSKSGELLVVKPGYYRLDVMSDVDVFEDVTIAYGYNNITPEPVELFTIGEVNEVEVVSNRFREVLIGLGFQEIFSPVLTNPKFLTTNLNLRKAEFVKIKNFFSKNYSAMRNSVLPSLLNFESKNQDVEFPHKVFEIGEVQRVNKELSVGSETRVHLGAYLSGNEFDFNSVKEVLVTISELLDYGFKLRRCDKPFLISGRSAEILLGDDVIGFIGEVHPKVLKKWGVEFPVVVFELDLTSLE